jgi:hypothetical protein
MFSHKSIKSLFSRYLLDEDLEPCALWCFGAEYDNFPSARIFCDAWNNLHGNVLKLDYSNIIYKDVEKMIHLWKNNIYGLEPWQINYVKY